MSQPYEDAIRYIRQHLLALEEGRDEDAQLLKEFVEDEFGVHFVIVSIDEVAPNIIDRWRSVYGLADWLYNTKTKKLRHVAILTEHANEPIWRNPRGPLDDKGQPVDRGPGALETPLEFLHEYKQPWDVDDWWEKPKGQEHLAPRSKDGDPIPKKVREAIRLWTPSGE